MLSEESNCIEERVVCIDQSHIKSIARREAEFLVEFGGKVTVGLVIGYAFPEQRGWGNYSESKFQTKWLSSIGGVLPSIPKPFWWIALIPAKETSSGAMRLEYALQTQECGKNLLR